MTRMFPDVNHLPQTLTITQLTPIRRRYHRAIDQ